MTEQADNIIRFPGESVARTEADAARWLGRMTSGCATLAEVAEFALWRAASPEHERIYAELEAMWNRLAAGTMARELRHRPVARWRGRLARTGWAQIAAAVAMVIAGAHYLTEGRYDYVTAPGEVRRVTLGDGSVMQLAGGTALDAHVTGTGARTIELARGEAFFEVRHDATRPFTVSAGGGLVRDIGTGFSVARAGSSTTVAVEHGAVAVAASGLSDTLTAGEQLSFDLYGMARKLRVAPSEIAAWRRGLYVADSKPLGEVLSDLDAYRSGRIVVTSHRLASRRVNAVVQLDHIDAWLDALNETDGVAVRRWGPLTLVQDRNN